VHSPSSTSYSNEGGGQAIADAFMRIWLTRVD
jgi:hypothetical protein